MTKTLSLLAVICCLFAAVHAEADSSDPMVDAVKAAIRKSVPLLEKAAAGSSEHRKCFTCHGHAMPMLAVVEARRRGFRIDEENLQTQLTHTVADLAGSKAGYLEGRGQGGGHLRAGYALWSLDDGGWKSDEVTDAVSQYLVFDQKAEHWRSSSNRPPSEVSDFAATYVALLALDGFGPEKQANRIDARKKKSLAWLIRTPPKETEDRVFRLLALNHLGADEAIVDAAAKQLLETQRDDGGWAQIADRDSDAYATGSALFALHQAANLAPSGDVYQRGLKYLLRTQLDDGSWHVRSRSKPFQTYYESGYPHEDDQFISMAAGSWATLALLFACPSAPPDESKMPHSSFRIEKNGHGKGRDLAILTWRTTAGQQAALVKIPITGNGRIGPVALEMEAIGETPNAYEWDTREWQWWKDYPFDLAKKPIPPRSLRACRASPRTSSSIHRPAA